MLYGRQNFKHPSEHNYHVFISQCQNDLSADVVDDDNGGGGREDFRNIVALRWDQASTFALISSSLLLGKKISKASQGL